MNVLYTCDNNYIWIMGISVISLFENNKEIEDLVVYLLGEHITDENKQMLAEIGKHYKRSIKVIDVPNFDIPKVLLSARWPLSAYTRLFSGKLLPNNIDRILYLDCDTIILGSIGSLDNISFSGKIVFGVRDCIGGLYKENIGLNKNEIYINAGVLLMNLDELRKIDIRSAIASYTEKYVQLINYADQDILNGIFKGRIGILEPKYDVMTIDMVYSYKEIKLLRKPTNFYTAVELEEAVNNPVIIHYTTNMRVVRPWFSNTDHPMADKFEKYRKISPWADRILEKMVFNSRQEKIIEIIDKLPKKISYRILGVLHSNLKPIYIRFKKGIKRKK